MNIKQVCEKFDYSESYVSKNFPKFQKAMLKKGIVVQKIGRGKNAVYQIVEDNSRAITLYKEDETRTVMLSKDSMQHMINMDFAVFIGIIMTPLQVFRGSYNDFLDYVKINKTEDNRQNLKASLNFLFQNQYIHYAVDKTDKNYFFAGIYRKIEEDVVVSINMIKICKELAIKNHKRSWVPMLKLWLGLKYLYIQNLQPYTIKDLVDLTGLSEYQIRENGKILQNNNAFRTDKVYLNYYRCLGKKIQLNVLSEGNQL